MSAVCVVHIVWSLSATSSCNEECVCQPAPSKHQQYARDSSGNRRVGVGWFRGIVVHREIAVPRTIKCLWYCGWVGLDWTTSNRHGPLVQVIIDLLLLLGRGDETKNNTARLPKHAFLWSVDAYRFGRDMQRIITARKGHWVTKRREQLI